MVRRRAMDLLARREHGFLELFRKLSDKFPDTETSIIENEVDKLRSEDLQSDERFVESYLNSRIDRGYGPLYLRQHLFRAGVSDELLKLYLVMDDEFWSGKLAKLIQRRFAKDYKDMDIALRKKLERFALSRGFTLSHVRGLRSFAAD